MNKPEFSRPLLHPGGYMPHITVDDIEIGGEYAKFVSIKPIVSGHEFPLFCDYCQIVETEIYHAKELVAAAAHHYILGYFEGKGEPQ